jgi:type II secretory pathway component PulM
MKATAWNLVVISPHSPCLEKIRVSCQAGLILLGAFVLAFLTTVFLLLMFPQTRVNESARARLAAENQVLRTENKNIAIRIDKLDSQVSQAEAHSQRIVTLMQTD